jgi:hypothetical protein
MDSAKRMRKHYPVFILIAVITLISSCRSSENGSQIQSSGEDPVSVENIVPSAVVQAVTTSGEPGSYNFSVTISSPDEGCDQYADWWEVLSPEGELIYRRILLHSHVNEQPFTRGGGPVGITAEESVIVRAHFHPHGYSDQAFQGSVLAGFSEGSTESDFAANLQTTPPLPNGCDF